MSLGQFAGSGGGSTASGVGTATDGQVLVNTSGAVAGKDIGGVGTTLLAYTGTPAAGMVPVWDSSDNRWEPGTPAITTRVDSDGTVVLASTDRGALVTSAHAAANAVSIAQAGTAGFEAGYFVYHCATGAGASTITPATSTINGAATLVLTRTSSTLPACALIVSDGTNYHAVVVRPIPAFDGVTTNFLRGDGTFAAPAGASFNSNDPATVYIRDDFFGALTSTGNIGQLGWSQDTIGAAPATPAYQAGVYPNLAIVRFGTNASPTAGQGGSWHAGTVNSTGNVSANTNWEAQMIFSLVQTTETRFRAGFSATVNSVQPVNGIYLRYDTTADTSFKLCATTASADTCVDTTVAAATGFRRAKLYSVVAGTVRLQMYTAAGVAEGTDVCLNSGGTGGCTAFTLPTVGMLPIFIVCAEATTQKFVDVDFFGLKWTSVAR